MSQITTVLHNWCQVVLSPFSTGRKRKRRDQDDAGPTQLNPRPADSADAGPSEAVVPAVTRAQRQPQRQAAHQQLANGHGPEPEERPAKQRAVEGRGWAHDLRQKAAVASGNVLQQQATPARGWQPHNTFSGTSSRHYASPSRLHQVGGITSPGIDYKIHHASVCSGEMSLCCVVHKLMLCSAPSSLLPCSARLCSLWHPCSLCAVTGVNCWP